MYYHRQNNGQLSDDTIASKNVIKMALTSPDCAGAPTEAEIALGTLAAAGSLSSLTSTAV